MQTNFPNTTTKRGNRYSHPSANHVSGPRLPKPGIMTEAWQNWCSARVARERPTAHDHTIIARAEQAILTARPVTRSDWRALVMLAASKLQPELANDLARGGMVQVKRTDELRAFWRLAELMMTTGRR